MLAMLLLSAGMARGEEWRALHRIGCRTDADLERLGQQLPTLARMGINVLILEVDYDFTFQSHPELRSGTITKSGARRLAHLCQQQHIRLIPQFECLSHQSYLSEKKNRPLLAKYPQFDLTPGAFPGNEGIYCREWDPLNPRVNRIVFALMDELLSAFQADALHVGMDEIFLIGSPASPSTKGKNPAIIFAKAINDYHAHLVGEKKVEMLMWGDRLIDAKQFRFGNYESSAIGTAPAVDMIPKDIIICPWHYTRRNKYASIPLFLEKGFRVLPASWNNVEATRALIEYSHAQNNPRMLGHLFTTWNVKQEVLTTFPPLQEGLSLLKGKTLR